MDDAPAVVCLFDDGLLERLCEVGVGGLVFGWMVELRNHMFVIIRTDVRVVKGSYSHKGHMDGHSAAQDRVGGEDPSPLPEGEGIL